MVPLKTSTSSTLSQIVRYLEERGEVGIHNGWAKGRVLAKIQLKQKTGNTLMDIVDILCKTTDVRLHQTE